MCITELWSYHLQKDSFDLTEGKVDHSKSRYFNKKSLRIKPAYSKLWEKLGIPDGQIIWCYLNNTTFKKTGTPHIEWHLKVPKQNILKYVDDTVWNRILGIQCPLPKKYQKKINDEAKVQHPENKNDQEEYIEAKTVEFWNQQPPSGDWWNHLLVKNLDLVKNFDEEEFSALLRYPVPPDWVVERRVICCASSRDL